MSRKDEISKKIFAKLYDVVQKSDFFYEIKDEKSRWLDISNEDDKDCISHAQISNSFRVSHHVVSSIVNLKSKQFFIISGVEIDNSIYQFERFQEPYENIRNGLVAIVLAELDIPLKHESSAEYISENILSSSKEDDAYKGHPIDDIKPSFIPVKIFNVTDSRFSIHQMTGIMLCKQPTEHFLLPFEDKTISKFEDIFSNSNKNIPFENLVYALHSVTWKHSFLDVYRAIENLYPIFAIKELADFSYRVLNFDSTNIQLSDFYRIVHKKLEYNGKEEDNLGNIISFTGLNNIFSEIKDLANLPKETHKILYKIRCSIVHFSLTKNDYVDFNAFENKDWNLLITGMLNIIEKMYVFDIGDKNSSELPINKDTETILTTLRSMIKN